MTREEVCGYSERIGGLSTRGEKEALWDLAMEYIQPGGYALEVGTWTGGSAVILGEVCRQKGATLICIDAFSSDMHSLGEGIRADAFNSVVQNIKGLPVLFMAGHSVSFLPTLKDSFFDFVFVDGDHHYPVVEQDIKGFWEKTKGVFFCHDYGNPCDVKDVIDREFSQVQLNHVDSSVWIKKS